ncbi:MAG: type IV pilus secretin PilQ [Deltaproteobacteria bacterium]|nr:type IV pilus secretin PilQ [Deltaproteobacteria bacterium]
MILRKSDRQKAGNRGYGLWAIGYGLWVLPIAYCLLPSACFVAYAETYNNINPVRSQHTEAASSPVETSNGVKARIEGDTTVFTMEVKDAELKDVLRALAKQNNLNIIVADDITAKATFSLDKITFKEALEIITKANGLSYVIQNNVLWIGKKEDISKAGEDIAIEIVQLNYTKAADVVVQLKGVLSERGSAIPDNRRNALILRDVKKNIEDAKLLIRSLDTRTMQVVIEARIIEVQNNFARDLGIQWGAAYGTTSKDNFSTGFGSTATAPPSTLLPSGVVGSGGRFSSQPNYAVNLPASGTVGPIGALGLAFGKLTGDPLLLDIRISAGERNGQLKIVSQPKVTTLNNIAATIHSGLNFKVRTSTVTTGTVTTSLQDINTGIDLTVTPQISADDFINLNIVASKSEADFARSVDGIPGVSEKKATTSVLVKDGETTVIGGLYKSTASDADNSIPYLSKIPVLGWLFTSNSKTADNEELLVFITPRIVRND